MCYNQPVVRIWAAANATELCYGIDAWKDNRLQPYRFTLSYWAMMVWMLQLEEYD